MGACNLYHACAHNMLHEKSPEVLGALLEAVSGADRSIVESALAARAGDAPDFDRTSDLLFCWAGELIRQSPAE